MKMNERRFPVVSNSYTLKCPGPYWSNPPFLKLLAFGHSGAQSLAPECPNVKKLKSELDQYVPERLVDSFCHNQKSVGLKGLKLKCSVFVLSGMSLLPVVSISGIVNQNVITH